MLASIKKYKCVQHNGNDKYVVKVRLSNIAMVVHNSLTILKDKKQIY